MGCRWHETSKDSVRTDFVRRWNMTGEAHWLDLAVILGGGIAVLALIFFVTRNHHVMRVRLRLHCPMSGEPVCCTAVQDQRSGACFDVERCSAFPDPRHILCGKECLRNLNRGKLRAEASS
jgi:hypothetical protein